MNFMNNEWFIVKDIDGLIDSSRVLVFNAFGSKDEEKPIDALDLKLDDKDKQELDSILSFEESKLIVLNLLKKKVNKKTKNIKYMLNETLFMEIIESLNDRMVSNILNNLVNKGLVETAYDVESNDFIFWISDEQKQNPETD